MLKQRIYLYAIQLFNAKYSKANASITALKKLTKKFDEVGSDSDKKKSRTTFNDNDSVTTIMAIKSLVEHPRSSLPREQLNSMLVIHFYTQFVKLIKFIHINTDSCTP